MSLWRRWVARCEREEDARPLALVRIFVAAALIGDLLQVARLRLVDDLFRPAAAGGIGADPEPDFLLDDLLGAAWAGPVAWATSLVALLFVGLGVRVRAAIVIGALAHAQLGHAFPPGDRAIDRLLRTALLLLLLSEAHRRFSLTDGPTVERIAAWPADLLRWILVLVYLSSGVAKLMAEPAWLAARGTPVLYRLMTDPLGSWLDPVAAEPYAPVFRFLGWCTILVECSSPLILTRWAPYWALFAAPIHLGIAATMKLGMFSWGMLALYPVLLAPWIVTVMDRRKGSRVSLSA